MDLLQTPTQISWTGNVEENFKIWFQKFELYHIAKEKMPKPDSFNEHLWELIKIDKMKIKQN